MTYLKDEEEENKIAVVEWHDDEEFLRVKSDSQHKICCMEQEMS